MIAGLGLSILFFAPVLTLVFTQRGIVALSGVISLLIGLGVANKSVKVIVFIICILIFFMLTPLLFSIANEYYFDYLSSFFVYGLCGLVYSSLQINYNILYRASLAYAVICMPLLYMVTFQDYMPEYSGDISGYYMRVSQVFGVILCILSLNIFKDKNNSIRFICFLLSSVIIAFMITLGARSFVLSFIIFATLCFLKQFGLLKLRYGFALILPMVFIYWNLLSILELISSFFSAYGIDSRSVIRLIDVYNSGGDASGGRYDIWEQAYLGVSSNPLFGSGIASFETKYGYYVHNFLLQFLYEGGILLLVPFIFILIKFCFIAFSRTVTNEDWDFIVIIFCGGVIYLFFSGVVWVSIYFWFFAGWVLNYKFSAKKRL